jgi:hypothetical protein
LDKDQRFAVLFGSINSHPSNGIGILNLFFTSRNQGSIELSNAAGIGGTSGTEKSKTSNDDDSEEAENETTTDVGRSKQKKEKKIFIMIIAIVVVGDYDEMVGSCIYYYRMKLNATIATS